MQTSSVSSADSLALIWLCLSNSVRFSPVHLPPENSTPPSHAPKSLTSLRLRAAHKFLCTALKGPANPFSAAPGPSRAHNLAPAAQSGPAHPSPPPTPPLPPLNLLTLPPHGPL